MQIFTLILDALVQLTLNSSVSPACRRVWTADGALICNVCTMATLETRTSSMGSLDCS